MVLVAHLKDKDSLESYFIQIKKLRLWFEECFLVLCASKTKELVLVRKKHQPAHTPFVIGNETVEQV